MIKHLSEKGCHWMVSYCKNAKYTISTPYHCVPNNWKNEESENCTYTYKYRSTLTILVVQRAWKLNQEDKGIAMISNKNTDVTLKNIKPRNMCFPLYWQLWIWTLNFELMSTLNFETLSLQSISCLSAS